MKTRAPSADGATTRNLTSGRTYARERSGSAVQSQPGVVENLRQCVVAIDGLTTVEGSGGRR